MKKRLLCALLAGLMLLCGCSAMLDRPYTVVSPHPVHPGTGEDDSTITVSTYSELVSAVLYFVSQSMEEGTILLSDYRGDVEADLSSACLEVAKDDPLGAYAVDFIKSEYTRVLTTYEAAISITYRRTPEQIRALVNVTGSSAIRRELGETLAEFRPEVALRIGYFAEDETYIRALVRQAYYDTPAAALGMPQASVALYPDQGSQRIVEILLTYSQPADVLARRSAQAVAAAQAVTAPLVSQQGSQAQLLSALLERLPGRVNCAPEGAGGSTVCDALAGDGGDDEGTALAFQLLCDQLSLPCAVTEGTLNGQPRFWNTLSLEGGETLHVDLSRPGDPQAFTDAQWLTLGYLWSDAPGAQAQPVSGDAGGP